MPPLTCVEVRAIITDVGRNWLARYAARVLTGPPIDVSTGFYKFRIGVRGFLDLGGGLKVPKEPLPNRTTIESDDPPPAFAFEKLFTADKVKVGKIVAGEFVEDLAAGTVLQLSSVLDFGEANDDGGGFPPHFFEIGVYDSTGVLVLYGTFPDEVKISAIQIVNLIRVRF